MKLKDILKESTEASDIIKDLDKVRTDLIKKVDVLIAKKKKLYSDVDITTPMSADEKQLDKDIQSIFSQIQQIIQQKRKIKTESIMLSEKQFKGLEGIPANKSLEKISKAEKLNIIKAKGNIINFIVPAGMNRNFWQVISTGSIKKSSSGNIVMLMGQGPMNSPSFKTIDDLIDGVDWKAMEQRRRFNEGVTESKEIKWQDVEVGDSANVTATNKTGVIVKTYGRKFHLKFVDGTTKTFDANELSFIKSESVNEAKEYKKGDKLKIKLPNGKKFDVVFDAYSRTKGVALGKFKDGSGEYDTKPFDLDTIVESINEGRGIKSIQNDLDKTVLAIESEIASYKATKGTPQEKKHIDNLKKLHPIKKKLQSELEMAVSGLYRDAELKIED